jgi:hypothetical protein
MCWKPRWLNEIICNQHRIINRLDYLMALVSVDQTVLDSIGTELGSIADAVQALVDNPDVPLGAADLSSITDAVSRIESSLTAPETPVEPPVEPAPVDPAA